MYIFFISDFPTAIRPDFISPDSQLPWQTEALLSCMTDVTDVLHVFSIPQNIYNCPFSKLTLKHRETHGCVVSTVATDALVLKHQAISILSTD